MRTVSFFPIEYFCFTLFDCPCHADWSTTEDVSPKTSPPFIVYLAAKTITEKMMWKAADQYPHIHFAAGKYSEKQGAVDVFWDMSRHLLKYSS